MPNQKGIVALIPLLLVVILVAILAILVSQGIIKNPLEKLPFSFQSEKSKEAKIGLKSEYSNPFDKSSQYVNPFAVYKNPFDSVK